MLQQTLKFETHFLPGIKMEAFNSINNVTEQPPHLHKANIPWHLIVMRCDKIVT